MKTKILFITFLVVFIMSGFAVDLPLQFQKAPATPRVGTERGGVATIGLFALGARMGEFDTSIYNFGITPMFSIWNNRFGLTGDVPTGYLVSSSSLFDQFSGFNSAQNINGGVKVWQSPNASTLVAFLGANNMLTVLNYEAAGASGTLLVVINGVQLGLRSDLRVSEILTITPFYIYTVQGASVSGTVDTMGTSVDIDSSTGFGDVTSSTLGFDVEIYDYSLAAMLSVADSETWTFSLSFTVLSMPINQG